MRYFLYILFCCFAFFSNNSILFAQVDCICTVSGKAINAENGKAIDGTVVTLSPSNKVEICNEKGEFKFSGICKGNYQLVVHQIGFKDSVISFKLDKDFKVVAKLTQSTTKLKEVEVIHKRAEMAQTQTVSAIKAKELDQTRGKSLGDALKTVSGVTTLNTGGTISKPMIHGMQGYRVLILNNGIRQEGQQWGNEHAPEIDPFIAQKLSVVKGANSVRYGSDAMAGVILIEPNDLPDTASLTGEINLVGMSNGRTGVASAIFQGYFDELKYVSWRVQGTLKKGGTIHTPDYYLRNTGLEESNFSGAFGYKRKVWGAEMYYSQFNTKIGIFSGAHVGNLRDLKNAFAGKKPTDSLAPFSYGIDRPFQAIEHELVKARAYVNITSKWSLKMQYAYQYNIRKEYDAHPSNIDSIAALNKPELDYRIISKTADAVLEHLNIKSFRGMIGASYMKQENVYLGRYFVPNFVNQTWGMFLTERFTSKFIDVEAGARYDEKGLSSYFYHGTKFNTPRIHISNVSWNTGVIYKPKSYLNIFLNVGSAWRAPAPNELYSDGIHHGAGSIDRGNPDLKTEQVYNVTLTGLLQLEKIKVELTGYDNEFTNFIYADPAPKPELTIKGAYPLFLYKQANVRIAGIDSKVSTKVINHIELAAKAMILRAWNYTINNYLIYMPADRYSGEMKMYTDFSKKVKDAYFQIGYEHVLKQFRVPLFADFAPPPPAYGVVSAEIGTTFKFRQQAITITLTGDNLLNKAYRDYLDRFRYFCDSQGRNFTLRIKMPLTLYDKK